MPGIVPFIPLIAAGATMVSQNAQNKAALKNNENQQTQYQNTVDQAINREQTNLAPWLQPGASPFAGAHVAPPPGSANGTNIGLGVPPPVHAIMAQAMRRGGPFSNGTPDAPWSNMHANIASYGQPGQVGAAPTPGSQIPTQTRTFNTSSLNQPPLGLNGVPPGIAGLPQLVSSIMGAVGH